MKEMRGKKKSLHILSLLAKDTMGNSTLNIKKLNTQIIKYGNRKKMKRSEA